MHYAGTRWGKRGEKNCKDEASWQVLPMDRGGAGGSHVPEGHRLRRLSDHKAGSDGSGSFVSLTNCGGNSREGLVFKFKL